MLKRFLALPAHDRYLLANGIVGLALAFGGAFILAILATQP